MPIIPIFVQLTAAGIGSTMTMLQIKTQVIEDSGHYELVVNTTAYVDNGIHFHINAAQRWLSRNFEYKKAEATLSKLLTAGTALVTLNRARYVKDVWLADATGTARTQLERITWRRMRELHGSVPLSEIDNGTPKYWCPAPIQLAPEQFTETAETLAAAGNTDLDFYVYGNAYLTNGIIIMPPPDAAYTLNVQATWLDKELTLDDDVSFWSVAAPELLTDATRLSIERRLHRNTQGVNDFTAPLLADLQQIYFDLVDEEAAGPPEFWYMK